MSNGKVGFEGTFVNQVFPIPRSMTEIARFEPD